MKIRAESEQCVVGFDVSPLRFLGEPPPTSCRTNQQSLSVTSPHIHILSLFYTLFSFFFFTKIRLSRIHVHRLKVGYKVR